MRERIKDVMYGLIILLALTGSAYVNKDLLEEKQNPNIRYATKEEVEIMKSTFGSTLEKRIKGENKRKFESLEIKSNREESKKLNEENSQIESAVKFILETYKKTYGKNLNEKRARFYAKKIKEYSDEFLQDIPEHYAWALAIAAHERSFSNSTSDLNLRNGYPPSRGIYCINDSTQRIINDLLKKENEEVIDIVGEDILFFPEKNIHNALWYIRYLMKNNSWTIEEALAYGYNPGEGWKYTEKVKKQLNRVKEYGIK